MPEAPAHPREVYAYEGGDAPERAFLDALTRGRLHHAWLLCGPEGVGKATFAYRAARRLLGAAPDDHYGLLGSAPSDHVNRMIEAHAHPDLMVLEREADGDKIKKFISVDAARALPEFFAKTPSQSPFRVAIVDAADDMNLNAANALLKTLEEPPERGVLFLVAHAPGRLMATIRSRCRRLTFQPWAEEAVAAFLINRTSLPEPQARAIASMARGAPGRALTLASSEALAYDAQAQALVEGEAPPEAELMSIVDRFRGAEGQGRFELFLDRLAEAVRRRLTEGRGGLLVERWAALWDRVSQTPAEADALNLDRADIFWSILAELRAVRAG
ncbi:MAG: DNA polymerase III subunit delta' [Caulobacteraceae bacterium]|nr:DNA polymerase III subunit delta' [Caulobacteraceae bacterium]